MSTGEQSVQEFQPVKQAFVLHQHRADYPQGRFILLRTAAVLTSLNPALNHTRFPPIALKWAAALLKHCDEPQHSIDLLGKDHFLLGKLLVTLGESFWQFLCG